MWAQQIWAAFCSYSDTYLSFLKNFIDLLALLMSWGKEYTVLRCVDLNLLIFLSIHIFNALG